MNDNPRVPFGRMVAAHSRHNRTSQAPRCTLSQPDRASRDEHVPARRIGYNVRTLKRFNLNVNFGLNMTCDLEETSNPEGRSLTTEVLVDDSVNTRLTFSRPFLSNDCHF